MHKDYNNLKKDYNNFFFNLKLTVDSITSH